MLAIAERVRIATKQYYTMEDTRKIMGISYGTVKPLWIQFEVELKKQGIRIPCYGIASAKVREYFGIDMDQLMREYSFSKELENEKTKQKNEINA